MSRGRRRSHRLELTTVDEGVNVWGRVNGGTRDDRKVVNWVGAHRGGDKEGSGLWSGLDPVRSRLRDRGTRGASSSAWGGGWGGLVGFLKGDIGRDRDGAG